MEQYSVYFALACAAAAVAYGLISAQWILGLPQGNERMRQIAAAIQEGAGAYMKRQYTSIAVVGVVIFVALATAVAGLPQPDFTQSRTNGPVHDRPVFVFMVMLLTHPLHYQRPHP